jgi:hypothetical protein
MLGYLDALRQGTGGVIGQNGDFHLAKKRTFIKVGCDEVDAATGNPVPCVNRALMGV